MHDTALELGEQFFKTYLTAAGKNYTILDVGSLSVNGSLRQYAPAGSLYTGVDLMAGEGVDVVLESSYQLPFGDENFDVVVSTSCFEHDPMFWLTFIEMVRVTKSRGVIYLSVPSNGWYHTFPMDNWRFYPDAGLSLESWAKHQGFDMRQLESFTTRRRTDVWNDCVMVFEKGPAAGRSAQRMCDHFPNAMNIRRSHRPGDVANRSEATEDQQIMHALIQAVRQRDARIAALEQELTTYHRAASAEEALQVTMTT
jgi:SAM-dependent methyltransferase